ncbi:MAG: DUF4388 domain-containing protein [Sandaracinus sp.]|nr:DUF4388 domain-containing protein [Sandaracinus sp.]
MVHAAPEWGARVAERLERAGWSAEAIEGGERALDRYVQEPSDAVVVDLDLRGRDGAATIESLRWAPGGRTLPIVLTGIAAQRAELEALGRDLGVDVVADGDPDTIADALERAVPGATTGVSVALERFDDDLYAPKPPRMPTVPPPSKDPEAGREGVDVERRARALAEIAEVHGRLETTEVAVVLARLADLRATGALVVETAPGAPTATGETPKRVVFFRNGVPVHVRSNLEGECLGQLLLRRGVIDRATLDESLARVRDGDGRQGGILVAMGALSPRALREALEQQQEEKLLGLFAWRTGSFHFSDAMTPPAETVTLELSLAEIVARALRTHVPTRVLENASVSFLDRFVWASELGWRGLAHALDEDERAMLDSIDGHSTLRTLLERHHETRDAALRAFHAARCLGSVTFREVALDRGRAADRSAAASKRLREMLVLLRAERYADVFEVGADIDVPTLRRRGATLRAEARKLREDVPVAMHPLSDELHHRLGRAEAVLVSERDRTDSDQSLPPSPASVEPPAPHAPLAKHEAVTKELPAAMEIPVRVERASEVEGDGPPTKPTPSPIDVAAGPTREVDAPEAVAVAVAPMTPDPAPGSEAPRPSASRDAGDASSSELDARVERMLQAERSMRRARRAIDRGQLAAAREAVERAVQLVPDEPEFAAELAWVDAKVSPDDATGALERLDAAAQLAPKNARVHVLRAEVLVATGAQAEARAAYERALAANPDDAKALAGLRALIS